MSDTKVETLEQHLREMESEDLLELDRQLRELMAMPGWDRLQSLIALHAAKVQSGTQRVMWQRLSAGRGLGDPEPLYTAAGRVRGLAEPRRIISKVLDAAGSARRQLGIDGEGHGGDHHGD